jgi:hypothetical protein
MDAHAHSSSGNSSNSNSDSSSGSSSSSSSSSSGGTKITLRVPGGLYGGALPQQGGWVVLDMHRH